jgi:PAS domain S-box-containing protein
MREVGFTSVMIVPLVARGQTLGALTFVSAESKRHYTPADLKLAEELALHAALAVDNARLYEASRNERERLQVTLASIGDAVIATDEVGRVTFVSRAAEDLTGWTQQEASGRPLEDVFKIINETNREPVESPVAKVLREGTTVALSNHTLLIRRDGMEIPIDDSGAPIRAADGSISGVVLVFRSGSKPQG